MKFGISREAKIGVFGITMLLVLYWGISFLKGKDVLVSHYTMYAKYEKSDNIEVSSPVLLKGVKIGSVTDIVLSDDLSSVDVTLVIGKDYDIPKNSQAIIANKSILGGKAVVIEMGSSSELIKDGDQIEGAIDNNMQEQLSQVKHQLQSSVEQLTKTLTSINSILDESTVKDIKQTLENVNSITNNGSKIVANSQARVDSVLSNLESVSATFKEELPLLLTSVRSLTDSINSADIASTLRSADSVVSEINIAVAAINSGQGTIGKLLYDSSVYDNLNGATDSLKILFGDIKSNPKRYVHFSVFGNNADKKTEKKLKKAEKKAQK